MPDVRDLLTALALLVAMVLAGWIGVRQRIGIVVLALLSLVWLTVDSLWEGGVLLALSTHHGITLADLVGIAGLLVAAGLAVRSVTRTRSRR